MFPLILIRNWRLIVILGSLMALVVFIYLWRGEIIDSAQNAYIAVTNANTLQVNDISRKASDEVKRDEQTKTDTDIINSLCALGGVMRNNEGCSGK